MKQYLKNSNFVTKPGYKHYQNSPYVSITASSLLQGFAPDLTHVYTEECGEAYSQVCSVRLYL